MDPSIAMKTSLEAEGFISDEEMESVIADYLLTHERPTVEALSALGWIYGQHKYWKGLLHMVLDGEVQVSWPEGSEEPICQPVEGGTA